MQLLQSVTSNITTSAQENYAYLQTIYCYGTFGGASVLLQGSPNGTEWFDLVTFTTKQVLGIGLNMRYVRAIVSGASGTTNITLLVE